MKNKNSILWLVLVMSIASTASPAFLARHYEFEDASNLGQATVGPDATVHSTITQAATPGGWGFISDLYLLQDPAKAVPESRMGVNAGALACWFKTSDSTTSRQSLVFGTGSGYFLIEMLSGGIIEGFVRDDAGNSVAVHSTSDLADGQWHHACLTWDGTTGAAIAGTHTLRLYIDGTEVDSIMETSIGWTAVDSWTIGGRPSGFRFNGPLDDVRIYAEGSVLTSDEVAELAVKLPADMVHTRLTVPSIYSTLPQ